MEIQLLTHRTIETVGFRNNQNNDEDLWISSFDSISDFHRSQTAEISLNLRHSSNKVIISSHCLEDDNGNDYFKLRIVQSDIETNDFGDKQYRTCEEDILNIWLFNQTKQSNYHFENFIYNQNEYLSDALLFKLSRNYNLIVKANTSIEEHEPRIDFAILNFHQFNLYEEFELSKWRFKDYL